MTGSERGSIRDAMPDGGTLTIETSNDTVEEPFTDGPSELTSGRSASP